MGLRMELDVAPETAADSIGISESLGIAAQIVGRVEALADPTAPARLDVTGADGNTYHYTR